ncbi:hypothetical protein SUGI_0486890 [Cryptomeria japonica]|nr:hypothetical protein SUGI_0486890 [Cryptomeria japonica]
MDIYSYYDIPATAAFIHSRGFKRVALQFPDEHLKLSVKVVTGLKKELQSLEVNSQSCFKGTEKGVNHGAVQIYVMADTTYSSCCVDEVGAAHANAECVVHYGPACFSPTSRLPAWFVFGKASLDVRDCADHLLELSSSIEKPLLVLFGLEYAYAMGRLKEEISRNCITGNISNPEINFGEALCSEMDPSLPNADRILGQDGSENSKKFAVDGDYPSGGCERGVLNELADLNQIGKLKHASEYHLGGLKWELPEDHLMEDYHLVWIGQEGPAIANVMLTYNACGVVRYDPVSKLLLRDVPSQSKTLKRRYYLVERAKDADIVGIVVGTLGIAGYREAICQLKKLIKEAGKKSYTFVMGRPNPAKLANFPECNIFVYVACAQTALLDSKEFLAPLITPFEAVLAFKRGSQWTGSYFLDFKKLVELPAVTAKDRSEEMHFSFIKGGYVGDDAGPDDVEKEKRTIILANATEKALQLNENSANSLVMKNTAKSGAEFLSLRSYQGLEVHKEREPSYSYIKGRSGRAWGYEEEANK